jgi:hypothetical protein
MTHLRKLLFFDSLLRVAKKYLIKWLTPKEGDFAWEIEFIKEGEKAIPSLQHHIGFNSLMGKLELRKQEYREKLESNPHKSLEDVYRLQAFIQDMNWIHREVRKELKKPDESNYYEEDLTPFVQSQILRIGSQG